MLDFFNLIKNFYVSIIDLFNQYTFTVGIYEVSYFGIIFGFFFLTFVVSVFWKGAKA